MVQAIATALELHLHAPLYMHDPDTAAILVHASALFRLALGLDDTHPVGLGLPSRERQKLNSTAMMVKLLMPISKMARVEILQALYLDGSDRLLDQRILNSGTESQTLFSARQILQPAMQLDARQIVLAHNHPCGNPRPSTDDVRATYHLLRVAHHLGVHLRDHIILTNTHHFSMREAGLIDASSFRI